MLKADQITTGNISFGIGIAAMLRTPGEPGTAGVEITPSGIQIIGTTDDTSTVLQPGLSVFKGSAEVTTLTVKGAVSGSAATLRQNNELSRGAKFTMSNGVTAPAAAPVPTVDWQSVPLTGTDMANYSVMDLQWDGSISRWVVFVNSIGDGLARALSFKADGTFDGQLGADATLSSAGGPLAGCRVPAVDNWYLWYPGAGDMLIRNAAGTSITFLPISYSSAFSMAYDGSNLIVGEMHQVSSSYYVHLHRFTTSALQGSNLALHGDFEAGPTDVGSYWTAAGGGSVGWTGTGAINGAGMMTWTSTGATSTLTRTSFAVQERMSYVARFKAKWGGGSSNNNVTLNVKWRNSSNTVLRTDQMLLVRPDSTGGQYTSYTEVAPVGATSAVLSWGASASGDATTLLDDITFYSTAGLQPVVTATQELECTSTVPSVNGLYVGNGDFGAKTWVIASSVGSGNQATVVPDAAGIENNQAWFRLPPQAPRGIGYDGSNFWTLGSDKVLYKHEGGANNYGAAQGTWKAVSTYRDTVNGYETGISPLVTIDMVRRARLTLTTAPLVSTGTGDPNAVGVYLLKNVTTPTTADYHFQGNAVANKVVVTNANFSGAAPSPVAFPASSPAEFRSAFSDPTGPIITLKGDGSGRIGQASWDTAGNWVGIGVAGRVYSLGHLHGRMHGGHHRSPLRRVAIPGCQVDDHGGCHHRPVPGQRHRGPAAVTTNGTVDRESWICLVDWSPGRPADHLLRSQLPEALPDPQWSELASSPG